MKKLKILFASVFCVLILSCDEDESVVQSIEPSFTVKQSPDDSSVYFFENTTPGKRNFYSFWQFEIDGPKFADADAAVEHQFSENGFRRVVLTVVSSSGSAFATEDITVTLPPPDDTRFLFNPENLLDNGYFTEGEGDDFIGWSKNNGADRVTASSSTDNIAVGYRSMKIVNPESDPSNQWKTQIASSKAPTTIGEKYTVSMWVKGETATVRISTNPGGPGDQYGPDFEVTEQWTQYAYTFTAKTDETSIALDLGATQAEFFVDAVELVSGDKALPLPSNDSELINGGLEEGTGDDFISWSKNNGADRITEETIEVLGGSRGIKVVNPEGDPSNQWKTQFVSDAFDTTNGGSYTISLWIKGEGSVVRFSTNPGSGGNDQYGPDYTATAEWAKYSWTISANTDTTTLALDMGATEGTFYIDNVKVVKN